MTGPVPAMIVGIPARPGAKPREVVVSLANVDEIIADLESARRAMLAAAFELEEDSDDPGHGNSAAAVIDESIRTGRPVIVEDDEGPCMMVGCGHEMELHSLAIDTGDRLFCTGFAEGGGFGVCACRRYLPPRPGSGAPDAADILLAAAELDREMREPMAVPPPDGALPVAACGAERDGRRCVLPPHEDGGHNAGGWRWYDEPGPVIPLSTRGARIGGRA